LTVAAHVDTKIEKGAEAVVMESRQPGDPPPSIRLVAPISGLISAVNVVPGQPITPDHSLIEIIDLSEVHAVAAVPEHFAGRMQVGQKGRIRAAGYPEQEFEAKVEHLGAEANAETDTIEVAFHVANPELLLRPGMRVEFSIIAGSRSDVLSIPRDAVQGDAGRSFVYIADYELPNAFMKTPVELGAQNDRFVEVLSGVLPGDKVVTRGSYALGFAGKGSTSLKEALDAAHGHP
ncbi:MAG: efflux RND transporter periplasmic adaptor subunit, partial [Verrucomicrobiota bacterium]